MLAKRIIPCLDIKNGRTVKGVNFESLRDAGDPVELAARYVEEGADELVFLDISATEERRETLVHLVEKIAAEINIPFTVGGGVNSVEGARAILRAGADKIAVNSAAVKRPELINELSEAFGNQCVVLAVDAKRVDETWKIHLVGGKVPTEVDLFEWCKEGEARGAGEILFTSMEKDGTKYGFEIEALKSVNESSSIPVIASGGAGKMDDFIEVFKEAGVAAALAASVFHYKEIPIPVLKQELSNNNIVVR
ncbi:MAG: imidazole glycerol phosphate synthase subunit HisF [Crocinitomicaceae bacterium]|nr:imidazole glycerol phosphate synthase subunit HisF [Crocinitomicaceae bacterium]